MQTFRGQCEQCGFTTAPTVGGRPALVLDVESADPDASPEDARLIILDDDGGRAAAARNGYTFWRATLSGRYLRVEEVFCLDCGTLFQIRRLAVAFAQMQPWLWLVFSIPFAALFYCLSPLVPTGILAAIVFGAIAGAASMVILDAILGLAIRRLYWSRAREFGSPPNCPRCGSKRHVQPQLFGLVKGAPRPLPCPKCGAVGLHVVPADDTVAT